MYLLLPFTNIPKCTIFVNFSLPLPASSVPYSRLDALLIQSDGSSLELDPNGRLGVEVELVLGEPTEKLRFPSCGVADHRDANPLLPPPSSFSQSLLYIGRFSFYRLILQS